MPQGSTARSNADLFALASAAALLTGVVVLFLSLRPLEPATELPNGSGMGGLFRGALELSPPPASSPVPAHADDPSEPASTLALAPVVAPDAQATLLAAFTPVPDGATSARKGRAGDRGASGHGPKRGSRAHGHASRSGGSDRTLAKVAGSDATTASVDGGSAPAASPHSAGGTGRDGLPPGLAKRGGHLPHGLAKRGGDPPRGLGER